MIKIMFLLLIGNLAWSSQKMEQKNLLKDYQQNPVLNEVIAFQPLNGYFFKENPDCGGKPAQLSNEKEIHCQAFKSGENEFKFEICKSNQETCVNQVVKINVKTPLGYSPSRSSSLRNMYYIPTAVRPAPKGFIQNQAQRALNNAKYSKKSLFIYFFSVWSEDSNLLNETTFAGKDFHLATTDLIKVRLDADSDLAWDWKSKFKIVKTPTLVVANSNLEEIDRFEGFADSKTVLSWVEELRSTGFIPINKLSEKLLPIKNSPTVKVVNSVESLPSSGGAFQKTEVFVEAEKGMGFPNLAEVNDYEVNSSFAILPKSRTPKRGVASNEIKVSENPQKMKTNKNEEKWLKVISWHLSRGETAKAESYYSNVSPLLIAKIESQRELKESFNQKERDLVLDLSRDLMVKYPMDPEFTKWLSFYTTFSRRLESEYLSRLDKNIKYWQSNKKKLAKQGLHIGDLYELSGDALKMAGQEELGKGYFEKAAAEFKLLATQSSLNTPRGASLKHARNLLKLGKISPAKEIYSKLAKRYKGEFSFNYHFSRALEKMGETKRGYWYAEQAYSFAYGDNLILASLLKSNYEVKMGNPKKAFATLMKSMNQLILPPDPDLTSHQLLAKMRSKISELNQPSQRRQ